MNNSLAVCILSHQIPNPHPHHHHLPLICKGDRREVLIKVIKRTNLTKSGAGFFYFFFILEGGVEVSVYVEREKKNKFQGYICILKHSGKVLFHV